MVLKHSDAQPMAEHKVLMQALKRAPRSAPWCRTALSLSWICITACSFDMDDHALARALRGANLIESGLSAAA
ncbi:hypothetical protein AB1Y20_011149 [Prymnesium parvum]|uniref:Uncharacterized protein n=1 Tax=Prymnesium parvum TaxID=97485 RepID=A0AB34IMA7_PRYPA